uniref:Uncharacterized protein n=1 Tax=Meloidogyne incognita TaxID=6306 RepID=A0A914MCI5_MELIC
MTADLNVAAVVDGDEQQLHLLKQPIVVVDVELFVVAFVELVQQLLFEQPLVVEQHVVLAVGAVNDGLLLLQRPLVVAKKIN